MTFHEVSKKEKKYMIEANNMRTHEKNDTTL